MPTPLQQKLAELVRKVKVYEEGAKPDDSSTKTRTTPTTQTPSATETPSTGKRR